MNGVLEGGAQAVRTSRRLVLRRDLDIVLREGVAWSVMVGMGETYFAAFVLALGMGEVWAGWITTFPVIIGGMLQLTTPYGVNLLKSRRRWVAWCSALQALTFIPLILGAILGGIPGWVVFATASLYWAAGLGAGPAWNAWMTWMVPARLRTRFFARRSGATNMGLLAGLLAGGLMLQAGSSSGRPVLSFAVVFAVAALARLLSSRLITRQSDVELAPGGERLVVGVALARRFLFGKDGRLFLYLGSMTFAVFMASPFFTPYMLRDLHFSYFQYMSLIGVSFLAKITILRYLGGIADRFGAPVLIRIAAVSIALIPAFWLVSGDFRYLIVLQMMAGTAWAIHEYASFLLFFDHIDAKERTSLLTTFNLINAIAMVGGSLTGGLLFQALNGGTEGYRVLFVLSCVVRLGVAAGLLLLSLRAGPVFQFTFRMVAVRPSAGSLGRPMPGSIRRLRKKGKAGHPDVES